MKLGYVCILPTESDPRFATHVTWGNEAKIVTARWARTSIDPAHLVVDAFGAECQLWDAVKKVAPSVFREAQARGWVPIRVRL